MSFLSPNFLWALTAILIPIIIHIFNFRTYKTVYFSNVALLDNIEQESKSRNKLKDLLILLFRILTIISLVIAFANPVKFNSAVKENNCQNLNCIYIDNSFSMNAVNKDGSTIEVAKSRATDIISSFKQNSKCLFLTNSLSSEEQHFYLTDIVKKSISNTSVSSYSRTTDFIVHKIDNIIAENADKKCYPNIYLISDFQKNIFNPANIKIDTNYNVYLIPISPNSPDNLYIDSCWFESPFHLYKGQDSIVAKIYNQSSNDVSNQQLKLFINDTLKSISTFDVSAHSSTEVRIRFTNTFSGSIAGRLEIEDYPVLYDNKMFFDYYIFPIQNILLIESEKQEYLEKFYEDQKYFNLTTCNYSNIPISELNSFQTIILYSQENLSSGFSEKLIDYIENGGVLVFIPKNKLNLKETNNFFEIFALPKFVDLDTHKYYVNTININDKIYKGAFTEIKTNSIFPQIKTHYTIDNSQNIGIKNILNLENNDYFLYYKEINYGTIYVFTSNLDEKNSDFMINPLSVPTFYNIPVFSNFYKTPYYLIGQSKMIELNNNKISETLKLKNINSDYEFFPQLKGTTPSKVKFSFSDYNPEAGNYEIYSGENKIGLISLNYSRTESDLQYYTLSELEKILKDNHLDKWKIYASKGVSLQNDILSEQKGVYFWKYFIIFALIFILSEILVIKLIKNK